MLCLFSTLSPSVGALEMSMVIIIINNTEWQTSERQDYWQEARRAKPYSDLDSSRFSAAETLISASAVPTSTKTESSSMHERPDVYLSRHATGTRPHRNKGANFCFLFSRGLFCPSEDCQSSKQKPDKIYSVLVLQSSRELIKHTVQLSLLASMSAGE